MLTLLVLQGPDKGRRFELPDAPTLIGRNSDQLPLTDNTVSRRQAELHPAGGDWVLKDLGSGPVLTVGEMPEFAEKGGVIRFKVEQDRIRLEINVAAAARSRLRISSQLLKLARIVEPAAGD